MITELLRNRTQVNKPRKRTAALMAEAKLATSLDNDAGRTKRKWTNTAFERRRSNAWVRFDPPIGATCQIADGTRSVACLVTAIAEVGVELELEHPMGSMDEFILMFTSGPWPVFRRCKTVLLRGKQMTAEFRRTSTFVSQMEPNR